MEVFERSTSNVGLPANRKRREFVKTLGKQILKHEAALTTGSNANIYPDTQQGYQDLRNDLLRKIIKDPHLDVTLHSVFCRGIEFKKTVEMEVQAYEDRMIELGNLDDRLCDYLTLPTRSDFQKQDDYVSGLAKSWIDAYRNSHLSITLEETQNYDFDPVSQFMERQKVEADAKQKKKEKENEKKQKEKKNEGYRSYRNGRGHF